jgi:signal transduction histidine kinase
MTFPARLRHPRVEDLGWLLEQVLAQFGRSGWAIEVSCPAVGVDCDPADVREMVGSVLRRADAAGAEQIGVVVRASTERVRVTVADDGAPSVFGEDGNAVGHGPVALRSAVRTRAAAAGATLTWRRSGGLNLATLELPRLVEARVALRA